MPLSCLDLHIAAQHRRGADCAMCRLCICFFLRQTCLQRILVRRRWMRLKRCSSSPLLFPCGAAGPTGFRRWLVVFSGLAGWLAILVTKAPFPLARKKQFKPANNQCLVAVGKSHQPTLKQPGLKSALGGSALIGLPGESQTPVNTLIYVAALSVPCTRS